MTHRKISDLPAAPYKALASEAERRGIDVTQGLITDATAVILIGALDIIRELSERIEALENASGLTPSATDKRTRLKARRSLNPKVKVSGACR